MSVRQIIINGRLGFDPEVKKSTTGVEFTSLRLAYNTPNSDIATWYNVTVWDAGLQKFCKTMKKGSSIIVIGDYSDNIYTNKNTGAPEIGRDIRATSINYGLTGGKKNEETENHVVQTTPQPQPVPMAVAKASVVQTTSQQPAPMTVAETSEVKQDNPFDVPQGDDGLPF